ncbi:hypothetical protein evm_003529 [Chilo suppressalis]|nr:hypothetical protein evm_003529 [Chilo suppressalis]
MDNNYLFKQGIVCQKHFETKFLTWTRTLSPHAVPTLHLPGGVLTEKLELQQNAVKKSKILSKNKLTASAMNQSVTNLKKVVKKLTEKNLKYTTRLKKSMKLL